MPFLLTLLSTLIISLASLAGVLTLIVRRSLLQRWLLTFVAFAAGSMLGAAMFHLLPEAAEVLEARRLFTMVTLSFVLFFLVEKVLHWRHCHDEECQTHTFGWMNLFGDSIHNIIDGLVIGSAFAASPSLGLITALAVIFHEIPQEIGDFGVLIHAGWPVKKALLANFIVAATSMIGGLVGVLLAGSSAQFALLLMPLAAGGFLYIAASDLLPELRQERTRAGSLRTTSFFLIGLLFMFILTLSPIE